MLTIRILFIFSILLFLSSPVFADSIVMKSGEVVEADIIERDAQKIVVEIEGVRLPYFLSDIEKINNESIAVVVEQPAAAVENTVSAEEQPVLQAQPVDQPKTELPPAVVLPPEIAVEKASIPDMKQDRMGRSTKQASPMVSLIIIIFAIGAYVYGATCLQMIAKKTSQGPDWHAWVPILNLMLLCRVAAVPYVWLLLFLGALIPFIGPLCGAAFSAFIWYKVAIVLKKPSWIGFLAAIPLVNFIVMGYFAFSSNN